jgi:ribbon-helix-helix protein
LDTEPYTMEKRTARLTVLVDPKKKETFEKLCDQEDVTPSQKIRQFMRDYIEKNMGPDWREKVFTDNE